MSKLEILTHVISHGLQHLEMINISLTYVSEEGWEDQHTNFLRSKTI